MKLDQFLKWQGLADTGGQAKHLVQSGEVTVNGEVETRRGRKLVPGDRVRVADGPEVAVPPADETDYKV